MTEITRQYHDERVGFWVKRAGDYILQYEESQYALQVALEKLARIERVLNDPPAPSRMLIPIIREIIHPETVFDVDS